MRTEVSLPSWLDSLIFDELGANYCRSNADITVIDWDKTQILNYLGTYFPRSFAESVCIYSEFIPSSCSSFLEKEHLDVLDFGCGTGGEIIGLLLVLNSRLPNLKSVTVKAIDGNTSLGNTMYERVAKGVVGVVAAIANANKKPETLDFNEIKHISSSLRGKYDALEEKLNLVRKEIDTKEQDLKDAGIFQKSLKSDLSKKIEQLKKQMSQLENELIDLKEKRQIVDNIIEPVSQKIEEYSVNLNRIAERYAVN